VGGQAAGLALAGTALGILVSLAAARGVSAFAPKYLIAITAESVVAIAVAALAMALVAALVPARFVARLDPASAFRR
jgi:ABC-type antimicrobial peptide transport system permease subunit